MTAVKKRLLYRAGYLARFIPHVALLFGGVLSVFRPPLSIEESASTWVRVFWCVFLVGGALLSAHGLRHSDDRTRVLGLFLEGFGICVYVVALVGLGTRSWVTVSFMVALAGFVFKSCVYAAIRLRAENKHRDQLARRTAAAHRDGGRAGRGMDRAQGLEEQEGHRDRG